MATIALSRRDGRDDTAETVFHQTHRAVCAARSSRLHQHRGSCVHHGRRTRRMNVTRYRSATSGDTRTSVPLSGKDFRSNHRLLLPVLTMTAGLAVLSVMLLRSDRDLRRGDPQRARHRSDTTLSAPTAPTITAPTKP
jgi:hypothetical protein